MSRSFRNTYREYSAKPLRGFHAGKIREWRKKRRYKLKKMVDEEGIPLLPGHLGKTWWAYGTHIWWHEENKPYFHFHRVGRKFIKINSGYIDDIYGKNLSKLGRFK